MIIAIIQARMSSERLPGKVMLDLAGEPLIYRVVERTRRAKFLDEVLVATSTDHSDDPLAAFCEERSIRVYRGALDDVLSRYAAAAERYGADAVVRITSDCPLVDPRIIDRCIEQFRAGNYDYLSNVHGNESTFPQGLDVEVFNTKSLMEASRNADKPHEREHVTPYIWRNPELFSLGPVVEASPEYKRRYRLTVDYPEDYELMKSIYEKFSAQGGIVHVPETLAFLDKHPDWVAVNAHCVQKPIE